MYFTERQVIARNFATQVSISLAIIQIKCFINRFVIVVLFNTHFAFVFSLLCFYVAFYN